MRNIILEKILFSGLPVVYEPGLSRMARQLVQHQGFDGNYDEPAQAGR